MVGGEITVDLFVADLIGCNTDRFGSYKHKVDYFIGRTVICEGCSVVELFIRYISRIRDSGRYYR